MFTYNNLFETELKKLIEEEIGRIAENLSLGLSVVDFPEYKHQVGQIAALRKVLSMCEEVQTIISNK